MDVAALVPAHDHPGPELPPLTVTGMFTEMNLGSWLTVLLVAAAAAYLAGVFRLRARGDHWPVGRTLLFLFGGLGSIAVALLSGLGAYSHALLSVHMAQHMILSMLAPVFLALGAPVTLALRTLPRLTRRALLDVLHSRPVRVLTFPLVAFLIFVASPFVLYFTGLYEVSLQHPLVHEWTHLHFLIAGSLFFWPLVGSDPMPNRWPYPGRVLLMVLMVPFHTVLGLTIYESDVLIAGSYYASLDLPWADPAADQQIAGAILWAGGEVFTVSVLAVLVVQWIRASEREARRIDRELDRAEAAAASRGDTMSP